MVADWNTDERIAPDGAVESEQQLLTDRVVVPPSEEGGRTLGRLYWDTLERYTRSLVHARRRPDDGVELRLRAGPTLLRFGRPEVSVSEHEVECRYPIEGGLLARREGGAITFRQERGTNGVVLRSAITGFHPTLAARPGRPGWTGALYAQGQSRLHVSLSRRYFARLLEEAR